MYIQNDNIIIRNAEEGDCARLAAWWNDGSVMAHAGFPLGLHTTAGQIRDQIAGDTDETKRRLIIEYKGQSIGEMSFHNMGDHVAEIGIKICEASFREKGLGRIMLSMLIRELFIRGYTRIILDTDTNNTRAQHVYEKLGFRRVRINENSWKDQLGKWRSSIDYELLPDDFIDLSRTD